MGFVLKLAVALVVAYLVLKIGITMLRGFGQSVAEPPPPGELRKLRLRYRCSLCGMEIRVDLAASEIPEAPRHCMEEMDQVAVLE
ncbi:MAG: hypothetical protein HYR89_06835 [Actinobacteria bacterium]|nr:hypothetical protein [Actinomycetota bacterium]MBI3257202.1 hypothetical protein [Actinomycetota bacterium]